MLTRFTSSAEMIYINFLTCVEHFERRTLQSFLSKTRLMGGFGNFCELSKIVIFPPSALILFFYQSWRGCLCFFVADWQSKQRKPKLQNLRDFSLLKTQIKITSSTLFTKKFNKNCEVNSNFQKKNVKVFFRI